jgi:8-oxo-dGTP pyrophosphatase MutT (NUDIX family)
MEPKIETIHSGKWLHYRVAVFTDPGGTTRRWEYVDRQGDRVAVVIVPICKPSGDLILVRQFRPALGADVLEFPAGLVDKGEGFNDTAIRELKEETGYTGQVIWETPVLCSSPGVTSERTALVGVDIDESNVANENPAAANEEDEWIEVVRIPLGELNGRLRSYAQAGIVVDSRVWAYLAGAGLAAAGSG